MLFVFILLSAKIISTKKNNSSIFLLITSLSLDPLAKKKTIYLWNLENFNNKKKLFKIIIRSICNKQNIVYIWNWINRNIILKCNSLSEYGAIVKADLFFLEYFNFLHISSIFISRYIIFIFLIWNKKKPHNCLECTVQNGQRQVRCGGVQ